ncbi:MAG: carboxypeptidase M32, partial [Collinsella bouchesdurhonensis]|nr:carboxypeptidase M32 [Collinsella bouchesdurhonensis]
MGKKKNQAKKAAASVRKLERKLWCRSYLMKIAEFDGATIAPENGAAARTEAMGTLASEYHKLLTKDSSVKKVRDLLDTIESGSVEDEQLCAEARVLARDQREALAIPAEEAEAWTRLTCEAQAVWHKAKVANDWTSFEPYIDRIVDSLKHQAALMNP